MWKLLGASLLLAGCATSKEAPPITAFDGTYQGNSTLQTLLVAGASDCTAEPHPTTMFVNNGQFSYTWSPHLMKLVVAGSINADGMISGQISYAILSNPDYSRKFLTVTGQVIGSQMNLLVDGPGCARRLFLHRISK